MKNSSILLSLLLSVTLFSSKADAFWWLFGKTKDDVRFTYLNINNMPFDQSSNEITFYQDQLQNGIIEIRGRAVAGRARIGSVQISLDDKESWQPATLNDDGAFNFKFRPVTDKTYKIYIEAMETAGKTNEISETYKEVKVSKHDISSSVIEFMNKLCNFYMQKNQHAFMELVSKDFLGDEAVLDRAIRSDFDLFLNIDLRYRINSIAMDGNGGVFVAIYYNRRAAIAFDGRTYIDQGLTEFVLTPTGSKLELYSMKQPVIFGVSYASEIASGVVQSDDNNSVLKINTQGGVSVGPVSGMEISQGKVKAQNLRLGSHMGYRFDEGRAYEIWRDDNWDIALQFEVDDKFKIFFNGMGTHEVLDLGIGTLEDHLVAPEFGYAAVEFIELTTRGKVFVIKLRNGNYVLLEFVDYDNSDQSAQFRFKYQPDGSRDF
ncbi:MAG: hypothetical protein GX556_19080 [Fibrobacter sp.]|nr:hypothetical protein [Fibrobacter sp.]